MERTYQLELTAAEHAALVAAVANGYEHARDSWQLERSICSTEDCTDTKPSEDCEQSCAEWLADMEAAELAERVLSRLVFCACGAESVEPDPTATPGCALCIAAAFEAETDRRHGKHGDAADHGQTCGHSACRQNWIDTGETDCIEAAEVQS